MQESINNMPADGGVAITSVILGASAFFGVVTSPVTAWLANLSQGQGALIGTIVVGLFGVLVREGFVQLRWMMERRDRRRKQNEHPSPRS